MRKQSKYCTKLTLITGKTVTQLLVKVIILSHLALKTVEFTRTL